MTCNNPKLDLVNVNVHAKFGQIHSQDIEGKRNSDAQPAPPQSIVEIKLKLADELKKEEKKKEKRTEARTHDQRLIRFSFVLLVLLPLSRAVQWIHRSFGASEGHFTQANVRNYYLDIKRYKRSGCSSEESKQEDGKTDG